MQQKFIKNLYQTLCCFIPCVIIIPFSCVISFIGIKEESFQYAVIIISIIVGVLFLFFLVGCYWMFQTIVIDEDGIQVKLFKKILRKVEWNEVEDIVYGSVNKGPVYIFKIKEALDLNIDCRKKIKKSLYYYGNEEIKGMVNKLKK